MPRTALARRPAAPAQRLFGWGTTQPAADANVQARDELMAMRQTLVDDITATKQAIATITDEYAGMVVDLNAEREALNTQIGLLEQELAAQIADLEAHIVATESEIARIDGELDQLVYTGL